MFDPSTYVLPTFPARDAVEAEEPDHDEPRENDEESIWYGLETVADRWASRKEGRYVSEFKVGDRVLVEGKFDRLELIQGFAAEVKVDFGDRHGVLWVNEKIVRPWCPVARSVLFRSKTGDEYHLGDTVWFLNRNDGSTEVEGVIEGTNRNSAQVRSKRGRNSHDVPWEDLAKTPWKLPEAPAAPSTVDFAEAMRQARAGKEVTPACMLTGTAKLWLKLVGRDTVNGGRLVYVDTGHDAYFFPHWVSEPWHVRDPKCPTCGHPTTL